MKRKKFLKNLLLSVTGAIVAKESVKTGANNTSTYDKLISRTSLADAQIGFNHIPNNEIKTMKTVLHKANTRGHANHGWLDSHHTFSFANYYNPERTNFGVLRVLNDDYVAPGRGFNKHPHDNMEIISIPLEGDLEHQDSTGNTAVIKSGDIQVMSAGTGIYHSEKNKNDSEAVKFLQIWLFPKVKDVQPRYDQLTLDPDMMHNNLAQILSPSADDEGVWIHQDAWFHMGNLEAGYCTEYRMKKNGNGLYAFVLEGDITIQDQALNKRDGFGLWDTDKVQIEANSTAKLLLMEVPMGI